MFQREWRLSCTYIANIQRFRKCIRGEITNNTRQKALVPYFRKVIKDNNSERSYTRKKSEKLVRLYSNIPSRRSVSLLVGRTDATVERRGYDRS